MLKKDTSALRSIGRTYKVFPIGLGGMPISIAGRPDHADAVRVIERFVEIGGNFIDSANVYCLDDADLGHNERLIKDALSNHSQRDDVVVATKGGLRRPGGQWITDAHPSVLRRSCERSLTDLGVDRIDLYQLHAVDANVPIEDSIGELARLADEGKIAAIGISNVDIGALKRARTVTPIVSVQNRCSIFCTRDFDNGLIAYCAEIDVAYIAHSPMGGHRGYVHTGDNAVVKRIADNYGVSPYRVALAWLLGIGPHIIPIPGARRLVSVEDSHGAVELILADDDLQALARIS